MNLVRIPEPARQAGWFMSLYPDAGEGGGSFQGKRRRHSVGVKGSALDPERSMTEAGRRARAQVRRYCASNGLNRLGTLTYRPPFCTDPLLVRADVRAFFKSLRGLVGEPFPYLWVPEYHKDGERFHVHFAVGRFISRGLIEAAWPHGFVHIKLLSNLSATSTSWHESRAAAGYLSKYVAKSFHEDQRVSGLRRFSVAEGFQPSKTSLYATSRDELIADACDLMGTALDRVWFSDDADGWSGPPALWLSWR